MIKISTENIIVESIDTSGNNDFLMDKSYNELRAICKNLGINSHQMTKVDMVHGIMQFHGEQETIPQKEDDLTDFNMFSVRYVGGNGVNRQNAQSTPTHNEYDFFPFQWVEVEELDFWHYHKKVEKSVESDQVPHWQCRRINKITGVVRNMFANAFNKLYSKPPTQLSEVKHITAERLVKLVELNIGSIPELLSQSKNVLREKLWLNPIEVEDMYDDARRTFK